MYLSLDGEEKARQIRGTENQGEHIPDANLSRRLGQDSVSTQHQSVGSDRGGWSSAGNFVTSRETIAGGILRQLIREYLDQVATKKDEISRLEARILELQALQAELEKDTQETS